MEGCSIVETEIKTNSTNAALNALDIHQRKGSLKFSNIGNPDDRTLWHEYRNSVDNSLSPDNVRTASVNKYIKNSVIESLGKIPGASIYDKDPSTFADHHFVFLNGHFTGKMDAMMIGVPEAPKAWHVVMIKPMTTAKFNSFSKTTLEKFSGMYYAEIQCAMGASGVDRGLFIAYCRDTGAIDTQRIEAEKMLLDGYIARAERIINALSPPASIYKDFDDFEAKKAGAVSRVYWGEELPFPNCYNCRFSLSGNNSKLHCSILNGDAKKLCDNHNFMPSFMPCGNMIELFSDCVEYSLNGVKFWNAEAIKGESHDHVYSSIELHHMSKSSLEETITDKQLNEIRTVFDGKITDSHIFEDDDIPF
jgi:hypothetical protein